MQYFHKNHVLFVPDRCREYPFAQVMNQRIVSGGAAFILSIAKRFTEKSPRKTGHAEVNFCFRCNYTVILWMYMYISVYTYGMQLIYFAWDTLSYNDKKNQIHRDYLSTWKLILPGRNDVTILLSVFFQVRSILEIQQFCTCYYCHPLYPEIDMKY